MGHCKGPQQKKYYVCVENWKEDPSSPARPDRPPSAPGYKDKSGADRFVEEDQDALSAAVEDDSEVDEGYEVVEEAMVKWDTGVDLED